MNKYLAVLLFFVLNACDQQSIHSIEFDSRGYEMNSEIEASFISSNEVGLTATRYSFVSEYQKLLQTLEKNDSIKNTLEESTWDALNSKTISADDYILQQAANHEIIMFNENHYLPRHRHFVKTLLPKLYNLGYRYLALEAIGMLGDGNMFDVDLAERGYPMKYTGHYLKESEFSSLVRKAIELNFHIIGYDEGSRHGYSGGAREVRGAENILSQIDSIGNLGKLIVLCGWDHLREGNSGTYWEYALAERLKQKTNNDPLTINQTEYNERLHREYEEPLMQKIETNQSIILVDQNNHPIDLAEDTAWYDAFVIHPRTKFKHGIPNWILEEGPIKKFSLSKITFEPPYKIFVFESGDDVKLAAPIFVSEHKEKNEKVIVPTRGKKIKLVVTNMKESVLIE